MLELLAPKFDKFMRNPTMKEPALDLRASVVKQFWKNEPLNKMQCANELLGKITSEFCNVGVEDFDNYLEFSQTCSKCGCQLNQQQQRAPKLAIDAITLEEGEGFLERALLETTKNNGVGFRPRCLSCNTDQTSDNVRVLCYADVVLIEIVRLSDNLSFKGAASVPLAYHARFRDVRHPEGRDYSLIATMSHRGTSTRSGHYFAHVKQNEAAWFKVDDFDISERATKSSPSEYADTLVTLVYELKSREVAQTKGIKLGSDVKLPSARTSTSPLKTKTKVADFRQALNTSKSAGKVATAPINVTTAHPPSEIATAMTSVSDNRVPEVKQLLEKARCGSNPSGMAAAAPVDLTTIPASPEPATVLPPESATSVPEIKLPLEKARGARKPQGIIAAAPVDLNMIHPYRVSDLTNADEDLTNEDGMDFVYPSGPLAVTLLTSLHPSQALRSCTAVSTIDEEGNSTCSICKEMSPSMGMTSCACRAFVSQRICQTCTEYLTTPCGLYFTRSAILFFSRSGSFWGDTVLEFCLPRIFETILAGAPDLSLDICLPKRSLADILRGLQIQPTFGGRPKRFNLQILSRDTHFRGILYGRQTTDEGSPVHCWLFDSFNQGFAQDEVRVLNSKAISILHSVPCPQQTDGFSCGPLTTQFCAVTVQVLANLGANPSMERVNDALYATFSTLELVPHLARKFYYELSKSSFPGLAREFDDLRDPFTFEGNRYQSLASCLNDIPPGPQEPQWFMAHREQTFAAPTDLQGTLPVSPAAFPPLPDRIDPQPSHLPERGATPPCPKPPIAWPPFIEPTATHTSSDCLGFLEQTLGSFPAETFEALVGDLIQQFPLLICKLVKRDRERFARGILEAYEQAHGSCRAWSIKNRRPMADVPGGIHYDLVCKANSFPAPKSAGGKKQRNRPSRKCGCPRSASLFPVLRFLHAHTCDEIPVEPVGSHPAFFGVAPSEEDALIDKILELSRCHGSRQFLRYYIISLYPNADDIFINGIIGRAQGRKTERSAGHSDIRQFLQLLEQSSEVFSTAFEQIDEDGSESLVAASWRMTSWPSPAEFSHFALDGASKIVTRDYVIIPLLGLRSSASSATIAVLIAASESAANISLAFTLVERKDPTLWRRKTYWMSDDGSGFGSALHSKPMAVHKICLMHKAANLFVRIDKGTKAEHEAKATRLQRARVLKTEAEAARKVLLEHGMLQAKVLNKAPYVRKFFAKWSDSYSFPESADEDPSTGAAAILMRLRNSPTIEHLKVRLFLELPSLRGKAWEDEKFLLYCLYLWETRKKWVLCCLGPDPDLGIGTNNIVEGLFSVWRREASHVALPLDEFFPLLNQFCSRKDLSWAMLQDGKSMKTYTSYKASLRNFDCLIHHLEKAGVVAHARTHILSNCFDARGYSAERCGSRMDDHESRKALAMHSAFAIKFIAFVDLIVATSEMSQHNLFKISVSSRVKAKGAWGRQVEVFYVFVLRLGSILCSCGYTVQNYGLPCPHVCACYEAGLLGFHAHRNLNQFWIQPPNGAKWDFSVEPPLFMQHSDLAFATHHADKGAIVPVLAGATWNPLLHGLPSRNALRAREAIEGEVSITYIVGNEAALGFDEAEVDSSQEENQDDHTISSARPTVIEGDKQALEDSSFQNQDDGEDEGHSREKGDSVSSTIEDDRRGIPYRYSLVGQLQVESISAPPEDGRRHGQHGPVKEESLVSGSSLEVSGTSSYPSAIAKPPEPFVEDDPLHHYQRARNHLLEIRHDDELVSIFSARLLTFLGREASVLTTFQDTEHLLGSCTRQPTPGFASDFVEPMLEEYRAVTGQRQLKGSVKRTVVGLPKRSGRKRKRHAKNSPINRLVKRGRSSGARTVGFRAKQNQGLPSTVANGTGPPESHSRKRKKDEPGNPEPPKPRRMGLRSGSNNI
jgi:Ubiquitin carboxyl-terminal hydrolase